MRKGIRYFGLFLLLIGLLFGCGEDGVGIDVGFDESAEDTLPPEVQGQAMLENMTNHSGISIELEEIGINLVTDADGNFSLLNEMADGEWTLQARYPFFTSIEQTFTVIKGRPEGEITPMNLDQQVLFDVYLDKTSYMYGETVEITLRAFNLTAEPITLKSLTSPMAAFAVRHAGETMVGGLFPGQGTEAQEMTLGPYESQETELSWTIDNLDLAPGDYAVYALLTNSEQFPKYFNADEEMAAEFNESLFSKLTPAAFELIDEIAEEPDDAEKW